MSELQIFENTEFGKIRGILLNNEPWFVGKDVATSLGYSNASKAVLEHVDNEDKCFRMVDIADSRFGNVPIGQSKTAIINESGLYSLILSSKLPTAKKFKHWVTSEVLPAIRKTGQYMMPNAELNRKYQPTRPLTTDDYEDAARMISRCHASRLPLVIGLLERAGLDIPEIKIPVKEEKTEPESSFANDEEWEKVKKILKNYSLREAGERIGVPYTSLCYYRNGIRRPTSERCNIIISVLG